MNKLKVKRLSDTAKLPERAHSDDSGYDIFADKVQHSLTQIKVFTGIALQPEEGYYTEVVPRSSISKKKLQLANSFGVIDYAYRGEVILVFNKMPFVNYAGECTVPITPGTSTYPDYDIKEGEKIAQLIVRKREDVEIVEAASLDVTARNDGSFGSTNK